MNLVLGTVLVAVSAIGAVGVGVLHFRTRRDGRSQTYRETALLLTFELICFAGLVTGLLLIADAV
ncbi:MAG: hypothetical protein JRJ58_17910 [Deltaproteobacteria bacterium]|nr:hypothetical protein [Deltaproteobacteria bacterium]